MRTEDFSWLETRQEGQFFERKSCYDRSGGRVKRRQAKEVARGVAETLSSMANADGGMLALGIEDNGDVTGVDYPPDRLKLILEAPARLVNPPLKVTTRWAELEGAQVLIFEVDWSPEVHQLTDGRYLLRVGDKNIPFPASDIESMKLGKRKRATELRLIQDASISDLNTEVLKTFLEKTGLKLSFADILCQYRLAESRNGRIVLSLAAILLFAGDPVRWHPACYVDFVKWEGTKRRFGPELNVVKRERIEGPLPLLIEKTFSAIRPHIRERHQLVDLFFEERFEYPTFAWQEAIINAVAHRDYALQGTPIEVWLFDDRMEIRSPGILVEPVTLERLQHREQIHASRNPRIVRVLTEWGFMRELGEGIPRMFEVMEREGLKPPEFRMEGGAMFTVVLYNTPIYSPETLKWLKKFEKYKLTPDQKRLLAYAHTCGNRFTSRAYQKLAGMDIYTASRDIKDLIRKGIVRLTKKGGRIYEVIPEAHRYPIEKPSELAMLEPMLRKQGFIKNEHIRTALHLSIPQARRLAQKLVNLGFLTPIGEKRGRRYVPGPRLIDSS